MNEITFNSWKSPNESVVKHFASSFDIVYHKTEEELKYLFSSTPLTDDVLSSRVTTLNTYYHTRLYSGTTDAIIDYLKQHGTEIEQKLRDATHPDYSIAGAIASCESHNNFSFATKYCSFVNPDVYPIFDNQVCRVLNYYQKRDRFYGDRADRPGRSDKPDRTGRWLRLEAARQECDYQRFVNIIDAYRDHYGLGSCTYREIDKFLWLVGVNVKSFSDAGMERDAP